MASNETAHGAGTSTNNNNNNHSNDTTSIFSASSASTAVPPSLSDSSSDQAPLIPSAHPHPTATKPSKPHHSGAPDILNSTDPSTAALRAWAREKQLHYPGQDGSFATGAVGTAGDGIGWGADSWILPHMGEKERAMEAERLGRKEEEEGHGHGHGHEGSSGGKTRRISRMLGIGAGKKEKE